MRISPVIALSPEQKALLETRLEADPFPGPVVKRTRIVLRAATQRAGPGLHGALHWLYVEDAVERIRILALNKVDGHVVHRDTGGSFSVGGTVVSMAVYYQIGAVAIDNFR